MTGYEQAIIEGSQTQSYISHMSSCLGFFTNGIPIEINSNFALLQENQISYSRFYFIAADQSRTLVIRGLR